jgi:hypothetical protein
MMNLTITRFSLMILGALVFAAPASAGWQSPFELTCFRKKQPQAVYYMAPPTVVAQSPCCNQQPVVANFVAPPSTCTQFVPRTVTQQVTNYQPQTVMEPRTEMRTSFFYEPVTTYRQSFAFDPCNCGWKQVTTPETTFQLRSQSTPVTTFVQRTQMVPVTQFRQMTYFEPQTTVTPTPAPIVGPWTSTPPATTSAPISATINPAQSQTFSPPPGVQESSNPNAAVQESRTPAAGSNESPLYRQNGTQPGRVPASTNYPPVKPRADRITSNSNNAGWKPVQATLAKHAIPE